MNGRQQLAVVRLVQNSIAQARTAIAQRLGKMYDGYRNVLHILGYKTELEYEDYLAMYTRQDVAGRIVDMPAQETWRNPPKLVAKKPEGKDSEFFDEWDELSERLGVFRSFEKTDRLSGIGRYGLLFIGVPGDLTRQVGDASPEDIMYLRSYPEGRCDIIEYDHNPSSPRFGQPVMYKIKLAEFMDPKGTRKMSGGKNSAAGLVEKEVHWSRVIHVAEDASSDTIYGRPRLERVFDRMWDMLKVTGGSAEMFWQNVAQIFHVNLDPELEYKDEDLTALDSKFKEMLQGLRRIIQTEGIESIKPLQGKTPDPRGVVSVLKTLIASAAEIPQRILFGSEQGEMASTQDKSEWYGRIEARRQRHAEPEILISFIMRLASWGTLVLPEGGIKAEWESLFEETPGEKAIAARNLSMTASKMSADRPDRVIGVREIRQIAGLPADLPAEVEADIEIRDKEIEEEKVEAEKKEAADMEKQLALAAAAPSPSPSTPAPQVA